MKKHILIVDDEQLILYGLKRAFETEEIEIVTASSGEKARNQILARDFDLFLLDLRLSDSNGLQLMKIIKGRQPEAKIILMTASYFNSGDLSGNIEKAIKNGACHFLVKPFDLCELTDFVMQALWREDTFHTGYRFVGDGLVKKVRKFPRTPSEKTVRFSLAAITHGQRTRWNLMAEIVDLSERGIGIISPYPLQPSQIISFDEEMDQQTGIVVWSTLTADNRCRAGVRFA